MFLRTVMCGQSAYDWKTMPMLRLLGGTLTWRSASKTVRSLNAIAPVSADSRPAMQRSVVVLPQPLGPSKTRNSPSSISRLRSSIAVVGVLPPKCFERPLMLTLDTPSPLSHTGRVKGAGRGPLPPILLLEEPVPIGLELRHLRRREREEVLLARLDIERVGHVLEHRAEVTLRALLAFFCDH